MIKFKNVKPVERAIKILSYDQVSFEDGQEQKYPVKKLVLTVEAGKIAELMVERYLSQKECDDIVYASISNGFTEPATFKNYYYIEKSDIPIEIMVSGPKASQETWNEIRANGVKAKIKEVQKKAKILLKKRATCKKNG